MKKKDELCTLYYNIENTFKKNLEPISHENVWFFGFYTTIATSQKEAASNSKR